MRLGATSRGRTLLAAGAGLAMMWSAAAQASVLWTWSFSDGRETGTFQTNGTTSDVAGPFNFVIDVATFTVTASTLINQDSEEICLLRRGAV